LKKILIITFGKSTSKALAKQAFELLGKFVEISHSIMYDVKDVDSYDLLIFSSPLTYKYIYQRYDFSSDFVICTRLIDHKNLAKLIDIEPGKEILMVNDGESSTLEAIEQLQELGLDHIKYVPFYPGCNMQNYKKYKFAITPGEEDLVPKSVEEVINIGSRIISIKSIFEIVGKLELTDYFQEQLTTSYIKDIISMTKSISQSKRMLKESEISLKVILNNVDLGIASTDETGIIRRINSKFESMTGKKQKDILFKNIFAILPIKYNHMLKRESHLVNIEGIKYLCTINSFDDNISKKYLFTFEDSAKLKKKDIKLEELNQENFNRILYDFSDYHTINQRSIGVLKKAKLFSKTDSNILIQGENGTGKEILAQAIHKNSFRKDRPFIPINITAISKSLLESELFGYEAGSFTGASKEGKTGIFEKAKGGTVFIDEIGDAPLNIQTTLLRVIQEKRIRKIGSAYEVPVDVRIVAATNKNLIKNVKDGTFREDLLFRLNVLPISTIPLRDRREDIEHLMNIFLSPHIPNKKLNYILDKDLIKLLNNHNWRGNVRELQNLVEYISVIYQGKKLTCQDLPEYILENEKNKNDTILDFKEFNVLKSLTMDGFIGRTKILRKITDENISEGILRGILNNLKEKQLIEVIPKTGAKLSSKGLHLLENYKKNNPWENS